MLRDGDQCLLWSAPCKGTRRGQGRHAGERYFERVLGVARKSWELRAAAWAKDPTDPQWENDAAIKHWIAWMSRYYPEGDPTSTSTSPATTGRWRLSKCCGNAATISCARVMRQAPNLDIELPMLLPGIKVSTGPKQFFPVPRHAA
jgi:hypothetical protein